MPRKKFASLITHTAGNFGPNKKHSPNKKAKSLIKSKKPILIQSEINPRTGELVDPNAPRQCSMYATRAARIIFGKIFIRGHAWDLADRNKIIKRFVQDLGQGMLVKENPSIRKVEKYLRPGHLVGLFLPNSPQNNITRIYTHVVLYLGYSSGRHWILENRMKPAISTLEQALSNPKNPAQIVDIIAPK